MRFSASKQRHKLNRAAVNLSSMIDVTFLLLVYFIVTTVLATPEDLLSPALKVEEGTSLTQEDLEPQIIEVKMQNGAPVYAIGEHICSDRNALSDVISTLPIEPGLIIRVGNEVPVGFAIAAIQIARDANFDKVTYVPAK
jgi:biopolymer transport protein ExbD